MHLGHLVAGLAGAGLMTSVALAEPIVLAEHELDRIAGGGHGSPWTGGWPHASHEGARAAIEWAKRSEAPTDHQGHRVEKSITDGTVALGLTAFGPGGAAKAGAVASAPNGHAWVAVSVSVGPSTAVGRR